MAGEELLITLGVQDKGANKQITALNKELKNLDKQYKSSSSVSKDYEKSLEGLQNKFNNLNQKLIVNQTKLSTYNKKMQETQQAIKEKEQELNKLNSAENVNQQAVAKATEQLERMRNTLRQTQSNIQLTENEIARLNNQIEETNRSIQNHALDQYKQQIQQLGEDIHNTGNKISGFGNGMTTVGNSLMTLSAPMIAFSTYATKAAIDFEQSMANLQATSGATGSEFTALENKAKELGENTCKSATDSANAMQFLALAGYDVNQILSSTEPVLKASVAWGADMATSADLATDSMSALGMSTDRLTEYLDVCSQAQRSSNTTATQMMEAYIGCGGTLKTLGVPLQESATWIGILANQGKKGAEAGNNLNSILVNLVGASSSARGAMDELGVSAWDNDGNFIGLTATLDLLSEALNNCTQEQKTNFQAAIGGKTQLDTLNMLLAGVGDQYTDLRSKINNATGATEEMYDVMNATAHGKIEAFKSKVEALGIQIGDKLLPHINDLLDKLMDLIDWFSNLDEGTQSAIIQFGLLTFATGGLLSATGKVVTNIGGLVTWIGTLTTSAGAGATSVGALGSALGALTGPLGIAIAGVSSAVALYNKEQKAFNNTVITSKEEMGFLESALLSLNGVQVKSREELENSGLVYKEFSNNLSDNFKEAVKSATNDINSFRVTLDEINMDNVLTDKETTEFTARLESTVDSAIQTIESKKEESKSKMNELFTFDDGIIDESEQAIIDLCTKEFETEAEEVRKNQSAINDIYNQARIEGRSLTPEEIESIKQYYANIKQIELECKAENTSELEYAEIDFNNRIKGLDAQGASELLVQKKSELDEQLIQKQNEYDQIIAIAQRQADQLQGEEKAAAEERVQNLKDKKQECIDTFNQQWEEYKNIVQTNAPDLNGTINKYNGEILTEMDLKMQQGFEYTKNHLNNLNMVTEEGWYRVYNTTTQSMDDVYVTVDSKTGEITACWDQTTGECNGYTEDLANHVKELGQEHEDQKLTITQGLSEIAGSYINSSGQMVDSMGNVISELYNVSETSNGTLSAIVDLNGTPVQIETNSDGVILSMHQVGGSMEDVGVKAGETSSEVVSEFQGAANEMPGIGSNIVSGIGSGIDSNKGGLFSKIGSLCSDLLNSAKIALDIHSPSRLFRDIIGKNIPLGIGEGILSETDSLNRTMENVLKSAQKTGTSQIKSFDSLGSKFVDAFKDGIKERKESLSNEMQKLVDINLERLKQLNNYSEEYYISIGKGYTADLSEEVERAFRIIDGDQEAINEKWRENNKKTIDEIKKEAQQTVDKWNEDSAKKSSDYYSKLYKQDLETGSKTLMQQFEKTIENGLTEAQTQVDNALSKLSETTEKKYNDLINRQKSMRDKLSGLSELYTTDEDGDLQLADLEDAIDEMKLYRNCLQQIKDIGTPNSFMQELESMDIEKANKVMVKLLNMDNESYWNFIDKFQEKERLAQKISKNYYKEQLAEVENNFTTELTSILGSIPNTMNEIGKQALEGFLSGMDSQTQRLLQSSTDIANSITNSFRTAFDIHSPSRVFKEIGSFVSEGLGIGMTDELNVVNKNILTGLDGTVDITRNTLINGFEGIMSKLGNILLSGGYYNPKSTESNNLINNTSSIINNYNNQNSIIDYEKLSNVLVAAIAGLGINVNVDADGIVDRSVNSTIRKLNKMYEE